MSYHEFAEGNFYFPDSEVIGGGLGFLPLNIFMIKGSRKTMLVDSGTPAKARQTVEEISKVIDPQELDYIFITHADVDHIGGVLEILKVAPKARVVGSMTVMGKGHLYGIPEDRFLIAFPGDEISLGDRSIRVEDSLVEDGHTNWLLDQKTRTYFTSDAFGAIQFGETQLYAESLPVDMYAKGFTLWHSLNFNSFPRLDAGRFEQNVEALCSRDIQQIASAHGPVLRHNLSLACELMAPMPLAEMPPLPPLPDFMRVK